MWRQPHCVCAAFLCLIRTIDPHGFHGIFSHGLLDSWIMDNVTCLIISAGALHCALLLSVDLLNVVCMCMWSVLAVATLSVTLHSLTQITQSKLVLVRIVDFSFLSLTVLTFFVANGLVLHARSHLRCSPLLSCE